MARPLAILDVSAPCFLELQTRLEAVGCGHAITTGADGSVLLDLHGLALRDEDDARDHEPVCDRLTLLTPRCERRDS
jgi:hypothetical protein